MQTRRCISDETRLKLSVSHMGKPNPHKGVPWSTETKAKMSAGHMGHLTSVETRVKLSKAGMGHITYPETCEKISLAAKGRIISPEHRMKLSEALKGRPVSPETRARMWRGGERVSNARTRAKRRLFGFVRLNEPFVGSDGHHVDNERVIYMPHLLHRSVFHRQSDGRGMAKINAIAYNYLFQHEVEAAMTKAIA